MLLWSVPEVAVVGELVVGATVDGVADALFPVLLWFELASLLWVLSEPVFEFPVIWFPMTIFRM